MHVHKVDSRPLRLEVLRQPAGHLVDHGDLVNVSVARRAPDEACVTARHTVELVPPQLEKLAPIE